MLSRVNDNVPGNTQQLSLQFYRTITGDERSLLQILQIRKTPHGTYCRLHKTALSKNYFLFVILRGDNLIKTSFVNQRKVPALLLNSINDPHVLVSEKNNTSIYTTPH